MIASSSPRVPSRQRSDGWLESTFPSSPSGSSSSGAPSRERGHTDFLSWSTQRATATSEETVYQVVKAVFENFDNFKKLHPAFGNLQESQMISDGLSAPLHDGAVKYYKERGWM